MSSDLQAFAWWCDEHSPDRVEAERCAEGWKLTARVGNSLTSWREVLAVPVPSNATPEQQREAEDVARAMAAIVRIPSMRRAVAEGQDS